MPEADLLHLPPVQQTTSPKARRPHQDEPGLLLNAAM